LLALFSINEVNLRRARLVLGYVNVSGIQLPVQKNLSQYITQVNSAWSSLHG